MDNFLERYGLPKLTPVDTESAKQTNPHRQQRTEEKQQPENNPIKRHQVRMASQGNSITPLETGYTHCS